ncbi:MAG: MBL fold metallo-hydrolase, partial [Dysgonamonadaceae bacterium]|nr:MBL fold metallo-hydrolase [Dysgonamonadaceae bacterium]
GKNGSCVCIVFLQKYDIFNLRYENRLDSLNKIDRVYRVRSSEIKQIGYTPHEITDVILTHLHFDHCGYATCFDDNQKTIPTFPNATYWLSKAQWENYRNPRIYEKDSFFAENIEPVFDSNQLTLIESDTTLFKGLTLQLYDGHTPGQIAVFIDTDKENIAFTGDVVPTSSHVSLGWLSAFDNNAALAMEEKKRLLDQIILEGRRAFFYHDAHVISAKVEEKNGYYFVRDSWMKG